MWVGASCECGMKRIGRILGVTLSVISIGLLVLLLVACMKDFRGMQYQRTEDRIWPSNGIPYKTPHFYSAGITSWRIGFYEWRDVILLSGERQERYSWEHTLQRTRARYTSNAGNASEEQRIQQRMNELIKSIESIDNSHLFDGDGISFASVEWSILRGWRKTWSFGGVEFRHDSDPRMDSDTHMLTIPVWYIFPLLLIMPMVQARMMWRARKRRRGIFCAVCGYDLRASPDRC